VDNFCVATKRLRKLEFHSDLGLNFDGLVVEVIGLVFPFFDGIEGGAGQGGIAAEQLDSGDAAILADVGEEFDGALDAQLPG